MGSTQLRGEGRGEGEEGKLPFKYFPGQFNLISTICPIRGNCNFKFIVMALFAGTRSPPLSSDGLNRQVDPSSQLKSSFL